MIAELGSERRIHSLALPIPRPCETRFPFVSVVDSIPSAITEDSPKEMTMVEAEVYAQQITGNKDRSSIISPYATLIPAERSLKKISLCLLGSGTKAGLCVQGKDIIRTPSTVEPQEVTVVREEVQGVGIAGFEIHSQDRRQWR